MTLHAAPRFCPRRPDLDDLELLHRGLYGADAKARPLAVPPEVRDAALAAGTLLLEDPEGVPFARLEQVRASTDGHLEGPLTWLGSPSPRPFAQLHLDGPPDIGSRPVVVVEAPALLEQPLPDDAFVLVVASTSLDGPTTDNATVEAAARAVAATPGARVGVVPLPPADDARRAELFRAIGVEDPGVSAGRVLAQARTGPGLVVLATGLSGSGKSTIARSVAIHLAEGGQAVTLLDGDRVRRHLSAGLGFSPADRDTNVRRIGWVAAEVAHHGGIAICSPIAPSDPVRREVGQMVRDRGGQFLLVHVATDLAECERRDRKGLYAAARRGEIPDFTGISAPYDVPQDPDLRLDTEGRTAEDCAAEVLDLITEARGRRA